MTDIDPTVRYVRAIGMHRASRDEKKRYLYDQGWKRLTSNRFRSPDGVVASFAVAVALQIQADLGEL